jgi:hypothetical protein
MTALAGELQAELAAVAPQAGQWLQTSVARQLEFSDADGEFGAPLPGRAFWSTRRPITANGMQTIRHPVSPPTAARALSGLIYSSVTGIESVSATRIL